MADDIQWDLVTVDDAPPKATRRPFVPYHPEYAGQAFRLALVGLTDTAIAEAIGVTLQRLREWQTTFPDFDEAIRQGGVHAHAKVSYALYQAAVGYSVERIEHGVNDAGQPTIRTRTIHYPIDANAAYRWLVARRPQDWAPVEKREISGPSGGAVQVVLSASDAGLM